MKEQYEKPKVVEIDLEESFSFGIPPVSPLLIDLSFMVKSPKNYVNTCGTSHAVDEMCHFFSGVNADTRNDRFWRLCFAVC